MNTHSYPDDPEDFPALPAGEMPDVDQSPPTEPAGPPAGLFTPLASVVLHPATADPPTRPRHEPTP